MMALASIGLLLHSAQPSHVIGSGVVHVRLLDGSGVSRVNVSSAEVATAKSAEIRDGEMPSKVGATQVGMQDANGYLPASMLSERPELIVDIDPEWYLHGLDLPSLTALLLINEYGDVDDLVIDTPTLTPMLLQDLKMRFRAVRFMPGRLHGQAVKVVLRVVIQLE